VEGRASKSHSILIPRRTSAVRVWAGATVAGSRTLTGGMLGVSSGLADMGLRWVTLACCMACKSPGSGVDWLAGAEESFGISDR
jgi:hypothetical protein